MSQPRSLPRAARGAIGMLGAFVSLGALGTLAACETHARGEHFAEQISAAVIKKGNEVRAVTCPDRIKIGPRDTVFPCQVELTSGQRSTFRVTLNVEGEMSWTVE